MTRSESARADADELYETIRTRTEGLDLEAIFIAEGRSSLVELDDDGQVVTRTLPTRRQGHR